MTIAEDRLGLDTRPLLGDLAYERLLADIVRGRYAPGQRLNLDEMAETFGISRTPLREALNRLGTMRFVETSRNARTTVSFWGIEDMRQRAQLIGRITAFAALAPNSSNCIPSTDRILGGESDVDGYLSLAVTLSERQFNRVGRYVARDLADPLRVFVLSAAASHGVDMHVGHAERLSLLTDAVDAFDAEDFTAASTALGAYAEALTDALTLPGAGSGPTPGLT